MQHCRARYTIPFGFRTRHGFTHLNCRSARTSRQHTRSARQDAHLHLWVRQVFSQHGPLEKAGGRGCEGLSAAARDLVPHGEYGPGGVCSTRSQDAPRTYKEPPPRQLRTRHKSRVAAIRLHNLYLYLPAQQRQPTLFAEPPHVAPSPHHPTICTLCIPSAATQVHFGCVEAVFSSTEQMSDKGKATVQHMQAQPLGR